MTFADHSTDDQIPLESGHGTLLVRLNGSPADAIAMLKSEVSSLPWGDGLHGRVSEQRVKLWLVTGKIASTWQFNGEMAQDVSGTVLRGTLRIGPLSRLMRVAANLAIPATLYFTFADLILHHDWREAAYSALGLVAALLWSSALAMNMKPDSGDRRSVIRAIYLALNLEPPISLYKKELGQLYQEEGPAPPD